MAQYPTQGESPWGDKLKAYVDEARTQSVAAAAAAAQAQSLLAEMGMDIESFNESLADAIAEANTDLDAKVAAAQTTLNNTTTAAQASLNTSISNANTAMATNVAAAKSAQTAAEAAAAQASAISGLTGEDGAVGALLGTEGTATRSRAADLIAFDRLPPMTRADKAANGIFRVSLSGMSIATATLPLAAEMLRNQYGDAGAFFATGGLYGGNFDSAPNGWKKGSYCGRGYRRLIGDSSATSNVSYGAHADTITLWFSVEPDAEPVDILVNGTVKAQSPAAGASAYSKAVKISVPMGYQDIVISKPSGSGRVYFEGIEAYDSSRTGVIVQNWTLGGSMLSNMMNAPIVNNPVIQGPNVTAQVGVDAYFAHPDIDLHIVAQDVNDAGNSQANFNNAFKPVLAKLIEVTANQVVPVILVSSMAGHYSLNPHTIPYAHAQYNAIRSLYREARFSNSHIEWVDWHGATILKDLQKYAATYYPGVTNLNLTTGSFNGDFIHPDAKSYRSFLGLMAKMFNSPSARNLAIRDVAAERYRAPAVSKGSVLVETATVVSETYQVNAVTDTLSTPGNHGLSVNDKIVYYGGISGLPNHGGVPNYVIAVPSSTTFQVSDTLGGPIQTFGSASGTAYQGARLYKIANRRVTVPASWGRRTIGTAGDLSMGGPGVTVPVYADQWVSSIEVTNLRNQIATSSHATAGTDLWGRHAPLSSVNVAIPRSLFAQGPVTFVIRHAGQVGVRASDGYTIVLGWGGQQIPFAANTIFEGPPAGSEPITSVFTIAIGPNSTGTPFFTITGAPWVYDAVLVFGNQPIWPGN